VALCAAELETYKRKETSRDVDSATVTFTFVQDNEDNVDALSFTRPTVRATVQRAVTETTFTMESLGGFSQMLADLEDAASNLQDAIAAPGELDPGRRPEGRRGSCGSPRRRESVPGVGAARAGPSHRPRRLGDGAQSPHPEGPHRRAQSMRRPHPSHRS
jgi:hypothetical protein